MNDVFHPPRVIELADGAILIALHDGVFRDGAEAMVDGRGEGETAALRAAHPDGFAIDVNCFALRHADGIVLIDVGTGSAWGPALGGAGQALLAAGFRPDDVRSVLLTHLHGDHALGLFDDAGEARYRDATIHAPRADLDAPQDDEAVRRVLDRFGAAMRPVDAGEVLPGIEAVPLPGHTVGHTGYLLGSLLLVTGDVLQLGTIQGATPSAALVYDADGATAERTRRDLLATAAHRGWTLAGSHLAFPGLITVEREGEAFRLLALADG